MHVLCKTPLSNIFRIQVIHIFQSILDFFHFTIFFDDISTKHYCNFLFVIRWLRLSISFSENIKGSQLSNDDYSVAFIKWYSEGMFQYFILFSPSSFKAASITFLLTYFVKYDIKNTKFYGWFTWWLKSCVFKRKSCFVVAVIWS